MTDHGKKTNTRHINVRKARYRLDSERNVVIVRPGDGKTYEVTLGNDTPENVANRFMFDQFAREWLHYIRQNGMRPKRWLPKRFRTECDSFLVAHGIDQVRNMKSSTKSPRSRRLHLAMVN